MNAGLTTIALLAATVTTGFSKAYFQAESEMVTKAAAIAIIDLSEPQSSEQKGTTWTYRQAASAKVIQRIKGDLPDTFTLYGGETFVCARCMLGAGRYLAFLRRDGDLWVGSNWHLSLRPLKDGRIEWFTQPEQVHSMKFQPSESVLSRVRKILALPKSQ